MGKREDRRYGGRLAVLTFVLLCLQGTGGQAYAQEDKPRNLAKSVTVE